MSAVCKELITLLCLTCTALCAPESGVVWKNPGEDLTIQCRMKETVESFTLKKGLNQEIQIFFKNDKSSNNKIEPDFKDRLESNGQFPNMDILIKNLTSADTGPYWCVYGWFDTAEEMVKSGKGEGSVLMVVKGETTGSTKASQDCETKHLYLVMVCVAVSVSVLLCIFVALGWMFIKTKKLCSTVKPSQVATSDVYEDMRGRHR